MGSPSIPSPPQAPDPAAEYQKFIQLNLKFLPKQLQQEYELRTQYDPKYIQEQQGLQSQYGQTQYDQMLGAFNQLDPGYAAFNEQLQKNVLSQYALGSTLDPSQIQNIQQADRGAQSARGNIYGAGAANAETLDEALYGQGLQQQRTQNAMNYLQQPTLAQLTNYVPPVTANRSSAYVNPNAGFQGVQLGQQQYANQLGAYGIQTQAALTPSPWFGVLGSLAQGLGSGIGMAAGASDRRLKKDIKLVGEDPRGIGIYEFAYKHSPKYLGYMADEVEQVDPGHVITDPASGYKLVTAKYAPVISEVE